MIVDDLIEEAAIHVHDEELKEIRRSTWLAFVKSASRHARSSGWYVPFEDSESILIATDTYDYDIPVGFACISELWREELVNGVSVYSTLIPQEWWAPMNMLRYNGDRPVFNFHTDYFLEPGKHLKVVGQRRPTVYSDLSQTIDPGMEGFMLERVLYYAFRFLGTGQSELTRWRQQMSVQSFQSSEALLALHPQEFRMNPSGIVVPGRG